MSPWLLTVSQQVDGILILEVNILRVVLDLLLLGGALIFCLLMILTLSRMLLTETSQCLIKPTSGSHLERVLD